MSLLNLPAIQSFRLPEVCAFQPDDEAVAKWDATLCASQTTENTVTILDVIGEDFWGDGVSSKRVAAALRRIGDGEVFVDLNSPGGDFFEGVAIYNMLRNHPGKVTVRIIGLAASAASVIAMAGDEILIGKAGFMMVHNAWVIAVGNRHDLAAAAETMQPFDDAMASVYAERAGVEKTAAAEWMDNETWFNGEAAVEAGLATSYLEADAVGTQARKEQPVNATRRVDTLLAKAGMARSERRSLLGELKSGTHDAAPTDTHDAVDIRKALKELSANIKT